MFRNLDGTPNPFNNPFHPYQVMEKRRLRQDLTFVGVLSLSLTLFMQVAFSIILFLLMAAGWLSPEQLSMPNLGLDNTAYLLLYMGVYTISLLLPTVVVAILFKRKYMPFSPGSTTPFGVSLFAIIGAVGLCMASNVLNSFFTAIFTEMGLNVPEAPQMMEPTPTSLLLNVFTMAFLPAMLEEMIYRGYILRTLRPYGNHYAVFLSAFLFSLMHGNLRQIPFALVVGLVLGYLYTLTNNIWIPIAVHFINNGISVLMEYLAFFLSEEMTGYFYAIIIYGFSLIGIAVCVIAYIVCRKRYRLPGSGTMLSIRSRVIAIFTTPWFLLSLIAYFILLCLEI